MNIVEINLMDLKPYEKNPRLNDDAVKYVKESIKQFGFKVPIVVDKNNVIVAGHTRWKASRELGLTKVPCIIADDLTDEQVKAFRIADNKVSELADWDYDLLNEELGDILNIDMSNFGFDEDEKESKINEEKPEVEFSEVLGEEHNYIVLYFDNDVDWIQAETLFDIKPVKCGSTRKDGKITKSMKRIGIGRVLNGAKAINKLLGGTNENFSELSKL